MKLLSIITAVLVLTSTGWAQSVPPAKLVVDDHGVDLISGEYYPPGPSISIGIGSNGMSYTYEHYSYTGPMVGRIDNFSSSDPGNPRHLRVFIGNKAANFNLGTFNDNGADFLLSDIDGAGRKLKRQYVGNAYVYTLYDRDGSTSQFLGSLVATYVSRPSSISYVIVAYWKSTSYPSGVLEVGNHKSYTVSTSSGLTSNRSRMQSITNNAGYQKKFNYITNVFSPYDLTWNTLSKVTLINNAIEYCDPVSDACPSFANPWPFLLVSGTSSIYPFNVTVTDANGGIYGYESTDVWYPVRRTIELKVTTPEGRETKLTRSSYGPDTATWTDGSIRTQYLFSTSGDTRTTIITRQNVTSGLPLFASRTMVGSILTRSIASDTDELGRTTAYNYDSFKRLIKTILPEGNYRQYTYDARGNLTASRIAGKPAFGVADIVETTDFTVTCLDPVNCNRPNFIIDPLGNRTDYSYDVRGNLTSVKLPAPTLSAIRPENRSTYLPVYAWYKNAAGAIVPAAAPIYKLATTSSCTLSASCASAAEEVRSSISYEIGSSLIGSNGLPVTAQTGSGNSALSALTSVDYDIYGNVRQFDDSILGIDDTTTFRYDSFRHLIGVVGPDPDLAGPLSRRSIRNTYNNDGQLTLSERGIVTGLSNVEWAAFTSLQQSSTSYDSFGREMALAVAGGSTTSVLTSVSYDDAGRIECVAHRLNPSAFGSLPASSCALGPVGASGSDRITKTVYDAGNQIIQTIGAYGTASQAIDKTSTYTSNGLVATLVDGNGNQTNYQYDAFDRLVKALYPNASGGGSSTTDFEAFTYDAYGRKLTHRRRDGQLITYTYDNLSRVSTQDAPATSWTYDNLSRVTSVTAGSNSESYTYDALDRMTSKTDAFGSWGYQYDVAGNRTRITYPDNYYVTYSYDVSGAPTSIGEAGGLLATYYYDNLGRRTGVARANGVSTTYGFDPVSRLIALTQDLSGTTSDVTNGFTYNPAGQILNKSVDNTAYIWSASTLAGTWTLNGLNQATSFNSASLTYDGRGNMTSDGTATYTYDIANRLTAKTGGPTLSYDAAGRLLQVAGVSTTRFAYDGGEIIAEYDGTGAMLRRYVPGVGADETLVWYEGSAFSDRRFLIADERGSVISVTNSSGASIATNTYDEYGMPAAGNAGRFQYTGQAYIAELGLYYYKARFYSSAMRRFLQPDPIGYGDGMAVYAYVGGDPVTNTDSTGTETGAASEEVTVRDWYRPGLGGGNLVAMSGGPGNSGPIINPPKTHNGGPPIEGDEASLAKFEKTSASTRATISRIFKFIFRKSLLGLVIGAVADAVLDDGPGARAIVQRSTIEHEGDYYVLKNGTYNLKFKATYYERLHATGRPVPFLAAQELLSTATNIIPDPRGKPGFFEVSNGFNRMVWSPVTGEVWHIDLYR